ncbi:NAD(P)-dependent alcohol dehydrogenase [Chloroflexota bacterium]
MKAMVYTEYGPPDVLQLKEVEKPAPKEDEVLVRVYATTVTTADANARGFVFIPAGFGFLPRLMFGIRRPKMSILGTVLAGEVEAVGAGVKEFKEGDRVFGETRFGAYAEYICLPEDGMLAAKPSNLNYQEAAAVPFGSHTALYFIRDKANLQSGSKILINGASGDVGTFAVQLARYYGAEVTGVCSSTNLELVKSLGAVNVIDYTKEDFTKNGQTYDIIYDTVGKTTFAGCKSSLTGNGLYLAGAGGLKAFIEMGWTSMVGSQKVLAGMAPEHKEDLITLKELCEAGEIKPVIDRTYPLEQMVEAHRYVDKGHKKGSVVIAVEHYNKT